jgi:hypothetical protein
LNGSKHKKRKESLKRKQFNLLVEQLDDIKKLKENENCLEPNASTSSNTNTKN